MKKGAKNSKTKRNEISSHSSKKNAVSTQENSSNEITDFRNYDNNEFEELISNRITQYTTENINLLLMLNRAYYTNEFQKIERYWYQSRYGNTDLSIRSGICKIFVGY